MSARGLSRLARGGFHTELIIDSTAPQLSGAHSSFDGIAGHVYGSRALDTRSPPPKIDWEFPDASGVRDAHCHHVQPLRFVSDLNASVPTCSNRCKTQP